MPLPSPHSQIPQLRRDSGELLLGLGLGLGFWMGGEVVKLLCSFGGELIREQGKPFYLGGKTRLVSIERSSSFRSLLSKMADVCDADPASVDVKYQLADGFLESRLVSVENDDDVRNMIDEFDQDRKIPVFLFADRAADVEEDDEEEEEGIVMVDYYATDGNSVENLRGTAMITMEDPCGSLSGPSTPATSLRRDNGRHPSIGPSMSKEAFQRETQSLVVGQEYEDVQTFRNVLTSAAIAENFEIHMIRSDQRRVTARCAAEGCKWRVHASKLPQVSTFRIRTLTQDHTCIKLDDGGHRQATAKWIASCIREKLRRDRNYKPREIVNDIQREYGVTITYKRAFLGREKALEELRSESVKDMVPLENRYEPTTDSHQHMDGQPWGEIHDPPRKKRICRSHQHNEVRPLHCTKCNQIGHNRRTCTELHFPQDGSS